MCDCSPYEKFDVSECNDVAGVSLLICVVVCMHMVVCVCVLCEYDGCVHCVVFEMTDVCCHVLLCD